MKSEKIVWGLILVFIGGILLLENFGVIDFYWRSVWRLWPLFLVIGGANMLFNRGDNKSGVIIAALITIMALGLIAYQGTHADRVENRWSFRFNDGDEVQDQNDTDTAAVTSGNIFSEPFSPATRRAELNIKGGATSYRLTDVTGNLFEARVRRNSGNYALEKTSRDSVEVLTFRMREHNRKWHMDDMDGNGVDLMLNTQPLWNINVEMGAGKMDFDLSKYKLENLTIQGGAAAFKLKLPMPATTTKVNVETGVAEVHIDIPSASGCSIKVDSGLSAKEFPGFEKRDDGTYQTPNYSSATRKIVIHLEGGLSKFEVNRY